MKKLLFLLYLMGCFSPAHSYDPKGRHVCVKIDYLEKMQKENTPKAPFGCEKCTLTKNASGINTAIKCSGCNTPNGQSTIPKKSSFSVSFPNNPTDGLDMVCTIIELFTARMGRSIGFTFKIVKNLSLGSIEGGLELPKDCKLEKGKQGAEKDGTEIDPKNYFMLFKDEVKGANPSSSKAKNYHLYKQEKNKPRLTQ